MIYLNIRQKKYNLLQKTKSFILITSVASVLSNSPLIVVKPKGLRVVLNKTILLNIAK